jgi:protein-tyrosine phosphatase
MGNICRSPTAEGVFRSVVEKARLTKRIIADSAGTLDYHQGHPPDPRAVQAAAQRGVDLRMLRARQVRKSDFEDFDMVIAMDYENRAYLEDLAPSSRVDRLHLLLDFAESPQLEVPDPYYGGEGGFETVLDLIEDGSRGLLRHLRESLL